MTPARPRGARGEIRFGVLLLAAVALVPAVVLLTRGGEGPSRSKDDAPVPAHVRLAPFHEFLDRGPTMGLWETRRLHRTQRAYFAPLRGVPERILMAPAPVPAGDGRFCRTCRHPCSYLRSQVLPFFFEAPPQLFRRNYRLVEPPTRQRQADGPDVFIATYGPKADDDRLTSRQVTLDAASGRLVRIEDFSRDGQVIRTVRLVATDTGEWDPTSFDPELDPVCAAPDPELEDVRGSLREMAARAGFPVVVPTRLPAGYELVRAALRTVRLVPGGDGGREDGVGDGVPARMATLLYSDGLGLISLAIATGPEMDAIEARSRRMPASDEGVDDATACPTLPAEPRVLRLRDERAVRVRTDRCRTVLRQDDVHGVSVTLLARNELGLDRYLDVMGSLAPLEDAGLPD